MRRCARMSLSDAVRSSVRTDSHHATYYTPCYAPACTQESCGAPPVPGTCSRAHPWREPVPRTAPLVSPSQKEPGTSSEVYTSG